MSDKIYRVVDGNGTPLKRGWRSATHWITSFLGTAKGMATRLNNEEKYRNPDNYRRNHKVQEADPVWRDLGTESPDSRTHQDMVREFQEVFDLAVDEKPDVDLLDLRAGLITEEFLELGDEFLYASANLYDGRPISNMDKLTKEMADLLYVVHGAAVALGIDLDEAFRRVHASNMSKLVDGKPVLRDDGKVLKGPNYFEPDLTGTYREEKTDVEQG